MHHSKLPSITQFWNMYFQDKTFANFRKWLADRGVATTTSLEEVDGKLVELRNRHVLWVQDHRPTKMQALALRGASFDKRRGQYKDALLHLIPMGDRVHICTLELSDFEYLVSTGRHRVYLAPDELIIPE